MWCICPLWTRTTTSPSRPRPSFAGRNARCVTEQYMKVHTRFLKVLSYMASIHTHIDTHASYTKSKGMVCRWVIKCDDDVHADLRGLLAAIDALPQVR